MTRKEFWSKTVSWLQSHKLAKSVDYHPTLNSEGLIAMEPESSETSNETSQPTKLQSNSLAVKNVQPADKSESIEKLQEGFSSLIGQLHGINEHLNKQVTQHQDLMSQMNQLPKFIESFPAVVENQKELTQQLIDQLKAAAAKNEQFADAVEKIPTETAKQTDALVDIDHQLAAAADVDVQMAENFNKFNDTLAKLDQSTGSQTDSILQMSRTFAASDRYLKYIISRQNKRFMWIFVISISVCMLAILILTGIVIYLRQ